MKKKQRIIRELQGEFPNISADKLQQLVTLLKNTEPDIQADTEFKRQLSEKLQTLSQLQSENKYSRFLKKQGPFRYILGFSSFAFCLGAFAFAFSMFDFFEADNTDPNIHIAPMKPMMLEPETTEVIDMSKGAEPTITTQETGEGQVSEIKEGEKNPQPSETVVEKIPEIKEKEPVSKKEEQQPKIIPVEPNTARTEEKELQNTTSPEEHIKTGIESTDTMTIEKQTQIIPSKKTDSTIYGGEEVDDDNDEALQFLDSILEDESLSEEPEISEKKIEGTTKDEDNSLEIEVQQLQGTESQGETSDFSHPDSHSMMRMGSSNPIVDDTVLFQEACVQHGGTYTEQDTTCSKGKEICNFDEYIAESCIIFSQKK